MVTNCPENLLELPIDGHVQWLEIYLENKSFFEQNIGSDFLRFIESELCYRYKSHWHRTAIIVFLLVIWAYDSSLTRRPRCDKKYFELTGFLIKSYSEFLSVRNVKKQVSEITDIHVYKCSEYRYTSKHYLPDDSKSFWSLWDGIEVKVSDSGKKHDRGNNKPIGLKVLICADTEFVSRGGVGGGRLTMQFKQFNSEQDGVIYDDWDSVIPEKERRFRKNSDPSNGILSYICDNSPNITISTHDVFHHDKPHFSHHAKKEGSITYNRYKSLPVFCLQIYAHFAVADIRRLFREGSVELDCIDSAFSTDGLRIDSGGGEKTIVSILEFKRRLRCETRNAAVGKNAKYRVDYIHIGKAISINGKFYQLVFNVVDTCAIRLSYKDLLLAGGVSIENKEIFTRKGENPEIERMDEMYKERSQDFEKYALYDLHIDQGLQGVNDVFFRQLEKLGIDGHKPLHALSGGKNVANIFKMRLCHVLGDKNAKLLKLDGHKKGFIKMGSADFYLNSRHPVISRLAKTHGGRCLNNRIFTIRINGVLVDIDIKSCYGLGLLDQLYFFGEPTVIVYEEDLTLEKFIKKMDDQLIDNCWMAIIDTKDDRLKYSQDLIASHLNYDTPEGEEAQFYWGDDIHDPVKGDIRVLRKQIKNGILTSSILEVLKLKLSTKVLNDFMKKVKVVAFTGYLAKDRCNSFDGVVSALTCEDEEKRNKHAWFGITMGEILVNPLLAVRMQARKEFGRPNGQKSPAEDAAKRDVNTTYGMLASPYFDCGNVVAANNVTANARVMVWLMEKELFGVQSITDGFTFDVNKIPYPIDGRKIPTHEMIGGYKSKNNPHIRYAPLLDDITTMCEKDGVQTFHVGDKTYSRDEYHKLVEEAVINLLAKRYPNFSFFKNHYTKIAIDDNGEMVSKKEKGLFSLELKGVFSTGVFHGASNYMLKQHGEWQTFKYRSYESNKQYFDLITDSKAVFTIDKNPAKHFLNSLSENKNRVEISPPFYKTMIIKPGTYKERELYFKNRGLGVGDTCVVMGKLNSLSISAFGYDTEDLYEQFKKTVTKWKDKLGWSYERFFVFESKGKLYLKYNDMIKAIQKMLDNGTCDIRKYCGLPDRIYRERVKMKRCGHDELTVLGTPKSKRSIEYHTFINPQDKTKLFHVPIDGSKAPRLENYDDFDCVDLKTILDDAKNK